MDFLGDILEPHTALISKFAATVTCVQFLSGGLLLNTIRKVGKSDEFPSEPFIGGVVLTLLSLKFGAIIEDVAMIKVNLFGLIINSLFTVYFYLLASKDSRKQLHKKLLVAKVIVSLANVYASFEDPEKIIPRFGLIITSILVILVGSPLLKIRDIIKSKSTAGFPVPIIISGTIVSASWFAYGLAIRNDVVIYQNLLLLVLGSIQIVLIIIYPAKDIDAQEQKAKKIN